MHPKSFYFCHLNAVLVHFSVRWNKREFLFHTADVNRHMETTDIVIRGFFYELHLSVFQLEPHLLDKCTKKNKIQSSNGGWRG